MTEESTLRVKRPRNLFFELADQQVVDLGALLRGAVELRSQTELQALSLLTSTRHCITTSEVELLLSVPRDQWLAVDLLLERTAAKPQLIAKLIDIGLLLSDQEEPGPTALRERDQRIGEAGWPAQAALYHFMNRWRDQDLGVPNDEDEQNQLVRNNERLFTEFAAQRGVAPTAFHQPTNAASPEPLPTAETDRPFYRLLAQRRTTRRFNPRRSLRLQDLSTLLFQVFGCHGSSRLSADFEVLHKTSPSGGALHPIEAYPLVRDVEDLAAGFYHYNTGQHGLSLVRALAPERVEQLADQLTAGQSFPSGAQVLVFLTARFRRNFWKYGDSAKTYGVVLMDAAHLSQTFYLVAAELGLGAFFSAAINGANVEQELGLEPAMEGSIAVCGCGVPAAAEDSRPTLALRGQPTGSGG